MQMDFLNAPATIDSGVEFLSDVEEVVDSPSKPKTFQVRDRVIIKDTDFFTDLMEIQEAQQIFNRIDVNGDGMIQRSEVLTAFGNLLDAGSLNEIFDITDVTNSEELDLTQFRQFYQLLKRATGAEAS